jgi:hypothetical protein
MAVRLLALLAFIAIRSDFFICLLVGWDFWYCGHYWPNVPAPDDRWGWLWRNWWNADWQGKPKYSDKTCPSATLSTTNPTWLDLGLNPGRGGKPAWAMARPNKVRCFKCSFALEVLSKGNTCRSTCNVSVIIVQFFKEILVYRQNLWSYTSTLFCKNFFSDSRIVFSVRTDGQRLRF